MTRESSSAWGRPTTFDGTNEALRRVAESLLHAVREAADPFRGVQRALAMEGEHLVVRRSEAEPQRYDLRAFDRVLVVGAGKASARMAEAVESVLGERIDTGLVVVKDGHRRPTRCVEIIEASHPIPDERSVDASRRMLSLLEDRDERTLVLCLLSGGGSSLLTLPAEGVSLASKRTVTDALLRSGAAIHEINAVRKHLSAIKGGWLAYHAFPAHLSTLVLSDVVGDRLDVIASGPTVPDASTFSDACAVLKRYKLWESAPSDVRLRLERGAMGEHAETPKPGSALFDRRAPMIVGSNALAIRACEEAARTLGFETIVLSSTVQGEAREVARAHAAFARRIRADERRTTLPSCIVSGGETTVTLRGQGKGGRNQEFALAAALEIEDLPGVAVVSFGTDGTDGPTDAAGAMAFSDTVKRAQLLGVSAREHLDRNDAYPFFDVLGDLIRTGPTGTNVMDVHLVLVA